MTGLPSRYEPLGPAIPGGMARVWHARDRETGAEVALKALAPAPGADAAEAAFLFRREYWTLAGLDHPGLPRVGELTALADGTPCFAMAWIAGQDLAAVGGQPEAAVRGWLPDLLGALAALHARGWVHGDLKPENVMITPDGRAVLLDLGLIARAGRPAPGVRGTPAYMAPEVVRGGPLDARTDLYALGCVLYEALAGAPPFAGADALGVMRAHLDRAPAPLGTRAEVSLTLAATVMRLLAKDPADRPADVAEVLADLALPPLPVATRAPLAAPWTGHADVLAALTGPDAPALAWVAGGAGMGKSRLLAELAAAAREAGHAAFLARGLGEDAPPYAALSPWLVALAAGADAEARAVLARVVAMPGVAPAPALEPEAERTRLLAVATELAGRLPGPVVWLVDDADRLDAASRLLMGYLRRTRAGDRWRYTGVVEAEAPDPAQDEGATAEGMATAKAGGPDAEAMATAKAGGPDAEAQAALKLGPLGPADAQRLAAALLGARELPALAAARVAALAGGVPAAIGALVARWLRRGALRPTPTGWEAIAGELDAPPGLAALDAAAVAALPPDAAGLAAIAAALGEAGDVATLRAAAPDLAEGAFHAALAALVDADVLALAGAAWRFPSARDAAAWAGRLDEAAQAAAHARAFEALAARLGATGGASGSAAGRPADRAPGAEGAVPVAADAPSAVDRAPLADVLVAARHAVAGAPPAAAAAWAERGAARALALAAPAPAEALLRRALARPDLPAAARPGLVALEARALRALGRTDDALARLEEVVLPAFRATDDPRLAGELVTAGILRQLKGGYDEARARLAEAIALADAAGDAAVGARARLAAGRLAYFDGSPEVAATRLDEAATLAERAGLPAARAGALALRGYLATTGPAAGRAAGMAMLAEAAALADAAYDLTEAIDARMNLGNAHLAASRFREAHAAFEAAQALCERHGYANELIYAWLNRAAAALGLGAVAEAGEAAGRALGLARDQGRRFPEGYALALAGLATMLGGRPAAGEDQLAHAIAIARGMASPYLELNVLVRRAEGLLHLNRLAEAGEAIAAARAIAARTNIPEQDARLDVLAAAVAAYAGEPGVDARIAALLATAREADGPAAVAALRGYQAAALAAAGAPDAGAAALAQGLELAQAAGAQVLACELGVALGVAHLAGGRPAEASAAFAAARDQAEAAGYPLGAALALAGGGAAAPGRADLRQAGARRLAQATAELAPAAAARLLDRPDRRVPGASGAAGGPDPALLGKLDGWLAAIAAPSDVDGVLRAAARALLDLAGAERGFALLAETFEITRRVAVGEAGALDDGFSEGIAYEALWGGVPVLVADAQVDARFAERASVQALAVRTALAVPLVDDDGPFGVLLADARTIDRAPPPGVLDVALLLAGQAARAVRALEAADRRAEAAERDAAVARAALGMVGARALPAAFGAIAAEACRATGADRAVYVALDAPASAGQAPGGAPTWAAGADAAGRPLAGDMASISAGVVEWVVAHGEPLRLVDAQADEAFGTRQSVVLQGLRTVFAAPVRRGDAIAGVLYADARHLVAPPPGATAALTALAGLLGAWLSPSA